jgi:hypothetical protein
MKSETSKRPGKERSMHCRVIFIFLRLLFLRPGTEDRRFSPYRDNPDKDVERLSYWIAFPVPCRLGTLWSLYRRIPDRKSLLFYLAFDTPLDF